MNKKRILLLKRMTLKYIAFFLLLHRKNIQDFFVLILNKYPRAQYCAQFYIWLLFPYKKKKQRPKIVEISMLLGGGHHSAFVPLILLHSCAQFLRPSLRCPFS